jgi:TonB family protein
MPAQAPPLANDPVKTLVDRLDLERYKATLKGLTEFGDRLEGTDRNRAAVDWIEQQLKGYGCANTERLAYTRSVRQPAATGVPGTQPAGAEYVDAATLAFLNASAVRVGGAVRAPTKLVNVLPVVAPEFQPKTQQIVILELLVDPQGHVAALKVLRSIQGLNQAAMNAARQWVYTPTLVDGVPRPVFYSVTVSFGPPAPSTSANSIAPPVARGTSSGPLGAITRRGPRGAIVAANTDPNRQPDERLRALNAQASISGTREEVWCTKVGTSRPDEMYIIGAHMDGRGFGEAANDDGSGTAIVMELARVFSSPDVQTERSIRFVLWNSEELGFVGANAYIRERRDLQGKEDPPGSGRYPEPKWLGMIQHDMMLYDHGMPLADGSLSKEQRPEADVNIEFQENSTFAAESQALARRLQQANERYATDYPAAIGPHMAATDSNAFQNVVAAVSLRENESTVQINHGWDPTHHQPTDIYANFSDKDFRLGLNAAQTTLGAVAQLTGASLVR